MNKKILVLLIVSLLLLTACGNKQTDDDKKLDQSGKDFSKYEEATIVTVNENNILVIKNDEKNPALIEIGTKDSKIYLDEKEASKSDLLEGMIVKIDFSGPMMMSYPGKMNSEYILASSLKPNQINDKIGFYVQVVKDMLEDENPLREETKAIGLDLDKAPVKLTEGEKNALEYKLKNIFEREILFTSVKELKAQSKIKNDSWKDGVLIIFNTLDKEEKVSDIKFKVDKWRSFKGGMGVHSATANWDEKGILKKIEYKGGYES